MTEEQPYRVLATHDGFEVRRYPPHLVAEVEVTGTFTEAPNRAFRTLVSYISGDNDGRQRIAMTAPVLQTAASADDDLPGAEGRDGRHVVAFVLPSALATGSAPAPIDPRVGVREDPGGTVVAATFRGRWTEDAYARALDGLRRDAAAAGLEVTGRPRFARFDPPWKPGFLRRNEVLLPVRDPGE